MYIKLKSQYFNLLNADDVFYFLLILRVKLGSFFLENF